MLLSRDFGFAFPATGKYTLNRIRIIREQLRSHRDSFRKALAQFSTVGVEKSTEPCESFSLRPVKLKTFAPESAICLTRFPRAACNPGMTKVGVAGPPPAARFAAMNLAFRYAKRTGAVVIGMLSEYH